MPPLAGLGHHAQTFADSHGCPACPHPCTGPLLAGAFNVFVNGKPVTRTDDMGVHAACCGPNTFRGGPGSTTVFVNGRRALRKGDATIHCGGVGEVIDGSFNVFAGG